MSSNFDMTIISDNSRFLGKDLHIHEYYNSRTFILTNSDVTLTNVTVTYNLKPEISLTYPLKTQNSINNITNTTFTCGKGAIGKMNEDGNSMEVTCQNCPARTYLTYPGKITLAPTDETLLARRDPEDCSNCSSRIHCLGGSEVMIIIIMIMAKFITD